MSGQDDPPEKPSRREIARLAAFQFGVFLLWAVALSLLGRLPNGVALFAQVFASVPFLVWLLDLLRRPGGREGCLFTLLGILIIFASLLALG